jgi:Tfp pilus assembly protein PilO
VNLNPSKTQLTTIGGILCLALIAGLSWMFLLSPRLGAAATLSEETQQIEVTNSSLENQIKDLEEKSKNLASKQEVAAVLAKRFPPTVDQRGMFEQILAAAASAGIPERNVEAISPAAPGSGGAGGAAAPGGAAAAPGGAAGNTSIALAVSASGSYQQLIRFINALERLDRSFLLTSVGISEDGEGSGGTVTISGTMWAAPNIPAPGEGQAPKTGTGTPGSPTGVPGAAQPGAPSLVPGAPSSVPQAGTGTAPNAGVPEGTDPAADPTAP